LSAKDTPERIASQIELADISFAETTIDVYVDDVLDQPPDPSQIDVFGKRE